MSYQSPIELMVNELHTPYEDNIVKAVQEYNITVNKDELLMALQYDRAQYDKGYSDGRFDRDREIVRCGECKWYFENEDYETLNAIPFCDHPEGGGVTRGKQWHCADGEPKDEVEHG